MTRIAIASCCRIQWQRRQPARRAIAKAKPDLVLLLGDNVYMREYKDPARWDHVHLENRYCEQFREPDFRALTDTTPFMATWDDHDFGPKTRAARSLQRRCATGRGRCFSGTWAAPSA